MDEISINLPNFDNIELSDDGTPLGTFKSVQSLKDAYDELRSCYTKNAMELAKLKQEQELSDKEISPDNVDKADAPTEDKRAELDLNDFFTKNPTATKFGDEIISLISQDKEILNNSNPLLSAWIKVLENKASDNEKVESQSINFQTKERIIQDYLDTVKSTKTAPPVITSREGVNNISTPKRTIDSLDDAFTLAKKLFE